MQNYLLVPNIPTLFRGPYVENAIVFYACYSSSKIKTDNDGIHETEEYTTELLYVYANSYH